MSTLAKGSSLPHFNDRAIATTAAALRATTASTCYSAAPASSTFGIGLQQLQLLSATSVAPEHHQHLHRCQRRPQPVAFSTWCQSSQAQAARNCDRRHSLLLCRLRHQRCAASDNHSFVHYRQLQLFRLLRLQLSFEPQRHAVRTCRAAISNSDQRERRRRNLR